MSLHRTIWGAIMGLPAPKPRLEPRDRFKLVHFDCPEEPGWEAHQWHSDEGDERGEWRPLKLYCGDFGAYWEDTRAPDRGDAVYAVKQARAKFRPCVVTEHEV